MEEKINIEKLKVNELNTFLKKEIEEIDKERKNLELKLGKVGDDFFIMNKDWKYKYIGIGIMRDSNRGWINSYEFIRGEFSINNTLISIKNISISIENLQISDGIVIDKKNKYFLEIYRPNEPVGDSPSYARRVLFLKLKQFLEESK